MPKKYLFGNCWINTVVDMIWEIFKDPSIIESCLQIRSFNSVFFNYFFNRTNYKSNKTVKCDYWLDRSVWKYIIENEGFIYSIPSLSPFRACFWTFQKCSKTKNNEHLSALGRKRCSIFPTLWKEWQWKRGKNRGDDYVHLNLIFPQLRAVKPRLASDNRSGQLLSRAEEKSPSRIDPFDLGVCVCAMENISILPLKQSI